MNYRNRKLLDLADGQSCVMCGAQDGTVVAAHSNLLEHGKGRGIKASDAAHGHLCARCHHEYDQGKRMSKEERRAFTYEMIARTYIRLVESGRILV